MQAAILTLVQDLVAIGGGAIVAKGWLAQSTETAVAGAVLSVATVVLGQFFKNSPSTTSTSTTTK